MSASSPRARAPSSAVTIASANLHAVLSSWHITAGSAGARSGVGVLLLREIRRLSGRLDGIEGDVKNVMTKQEHSSEIVYDLREQLAHISRRV